MRRNICLDFIIYLIENQFGDLEWISVLHFLIFVVYHFPLDILHEGKVCLVICGETQFVSDHHYIIQVSFRHNEHWSEICNDNQDCERKLKEEVKTRIRRVLWLLWYLSLRHHAWLWTAPESAVHAPFLRTCAILTLHFVLFIFRGQWLKKLIAACWHLCYECIWNLYEQE